MPAKHMGSHVSVCYRGPKARIGQRLREIMGAVHAFLQNCAVMPRYFKAFHYLEAGQGQKKGIKQRHFEPTVLCTRLLPSTKLELGTSCCRNHGSAYQFYRSTRRKLETSGSPWGIPPYLHPYQRVHGASCDPKT
jgi:hypothetical protein